MELPLLLTGLILGFSIAAPVGPIGVLCIRRTLAAGRAAGLVSGLGAATADAVYGSIAAFGLTAFSGLLLDWQVGLRLVGGLFLIYLGIRTFMAQPVAESAVAGGNSLVSDYTSTLFLTLTNPMTILSFAAIFAGLGLATAEESYGSAIILVLGVFFGSALWWLTLSTGVGLFRSRFSARSMRWVNIIAGIIITAFGLTALISAIQLVLA